MNSPLITTVIPTYRRPELLRRAIESVLLQSFKDFRVCVYDNASGDETEQIVKEYAKRDDRVTYYKNERNIGPVPNMKNGVAAVTTPFYSLLNDDDFLLPDFYYNAMEAIKECPEAGFVCAKAITIDLTENRFTHRNEDWSAGVYRPSPKVMKQLYDSHFTQTGIVLHTKIRDEIGCFEPSGDDCLYQTMASSCTPFVVLDYYGAVYTVHEAAFSFTEGVRNTSSQEIKDQFIETLTVCTNMKIPSDIKSYLAMIIVKSYAKSLDKIYIKHHLNSDADDTMPSLFTMPGFVKIAYEISPSRLHKSISFVVKVVSYVRKIKQNIMNVGQSNSGDLSDSAIKYFENKSTDIRSIEKSLM